MDSCHQFLVPSSSSSTSSPRSSRLSILTSSSSISSALSEFQVPSPLPSPAFSVTSSSSKTHAFFGSPFSDGSSPPLPPPNPPTRSSSLKSDASSHSSHLSSDDTPKVDAHPVPRSLNADFFSTSPPSIRSFATTSSSLSPDNSPPASPPSHPRKTILPPLSRFFPSRARLSHIDALPSRQPSRTTHRQFIDVESTQPPHTYHPSSSSRTSSSERDSRSSVERASTPPTPDPSSLISIPSPSPSHNNKPLPDPIDPVLPLKQGDVVSDASLSLELVRTLGHGAFSSVWLAKDIHNQLPALELSRRSSLVRSRSKKKNRPIQGTLPTKVRPTTTKQQHGLTERERTNSDSSFYLRSHSPLPDAGSREPGRLVAVKLTDRKLCDRNDRSRVSFIREVEVLRHISHPSIVSYLHSFSTSAHHCLVLEHVGGGELFDLIDSEESHAKVDEPLLRRMFGELCKAVGWMHAVGLVHRDIKLENILLTTNPFHNPLPPYPIPLIKLTDFGLSRFIDPSQPLLTTRCGSESYAAPELVTGRAYDGRETDAWACGVVLYAVATRRLPFDRPTSSRRVREVREGERNERKALLIRIAKGEYTWPTNGGEDGGRERLGRSEGLRRVVGRLLERDPRKRVRVVDIWEDEWMRGVGAPPPPVMLPFDAVPADDEVLARDEEEDEVYVEGLEGEDGEEEEEDGLLVDGQEIGPGHVVRQEHY